MVSGNPRIEEVSDSEISPNKHRLGIQKDLKTKEDDNKFTFIQSDEKED